MTTPEDKRKYVALDKILEKINRNHISLSEKDCERNSAILLQLLGLLPRKMKEKDNLFNEMYTGVFYGGSFYDGLRVGQPDEFDLDLLLTLPELVKIDRRIANKPGYLTIQLDLTDLHKQAELNKRYKGLKEKLLDENNYLDTGKVRRWMEGVIITSLNYFPCNNSIYTLSIPQGILYVKIHKAGPAFTLKVNGNVGGTVINVDIDLVPCFKFTSQYWPPSPYKEKPAGCNKPNYFIVPKPIKNPLPVTSQYFRPSPYKGKPAGSNKPNYFIVPKPMKDTLPVTQRFWRLSFQEQERDILNNKGFLKPSIKLMKKLRDTLQHKCIASYYIKTVALWEVEKKGSALWGSSLSYAFMTLLNTYVEMLEKGSIPYYWNKNNNLIGQIQSITRSNIVGRLKAIIKDVEKHLSDDPMKIAKYILTPAEYENFIAINQQGFTIMENTIGEATTTKSTESNCLIM